MATRYITRSTLLTIKQTLTSVAVSRHSLRHRPLIAAASAFHFGRDEGNVFSARSFATRQTTSSLNDPNPNFTNRPPKETILLDGCDFEHWLVVMEKPEGDPSRDEIIDSYIKTVAMVVGSEEEARMKIYSVSTRHYFAFGALVSEELSYKLKELPRVRWVLPDSYLDVKNEDYGGEPFINGQAVPYDPKYHEEWVRNNARANNPKGRNNRPRNFDRPRNLERSREMQTTNQHPGDPQNMDQRPPSPSGPHTGAMNPNLHQQPNIGAQHGNAPNSGGVPHQSNTGLYNTNPGPGFVPNAGPGPSHNQGGYAPNGGPVQNLGGYGPNMGPGPSHSQVACAPNSGPVQNQGGYGPNMGPGPVPNQGGYAPNSGPVPVQSQGGYAQDRSGVNHYQGQNMSGRD